MEEGAPDGERQQIIDDVEHDEFSDLSPNLGFISRSDVQQERLEHFAGIIASQNTFESTPNRRIRDVNYISVFEGCIMSKLQQNTHFFGG
jgi:hypothetical protein